MNDKKIFEAWAEKNLCDDRHLAEACGVFELVGAQVQAEEILTAGNSFFDKNFFGTRVLILAPHPDDEINVAGNMILNLSAAKAEIFVAYSTNGDFEISADVRAQEAVDALKILGVPAERIIFLATATGTNFPTSRRLRPQATRKLTRRKILSTTRKKLSGGTVPTRGKISSAI